MSVHAKNHEDLVKFYIGDKSGKSNIFEVWENGGSHGDSVTPSTYSPEYRAWMADRLTSELQLNGGALLSLGCGNAAVEAEVQRRGFRVLAIDAMQDAVDLARQKGIEAICADIYSWQPSEPFSVIYIDGVLGHLNDDAEGLVPVLSRIRTWLSPLNGRATLLASNDAPKNDEKVQKAPGVNGFSWLSGEYIGEQAMKAGFTSADVGEFRYTRPISGGRVRAVVAAQL
ncbi:class I SAM-dependent methyltransferase [Lentzea alba]|uniref:class I SAM-dependent methyltransferase n=1 Tax=Lentzea alba TaxID=2714351 RepID=UPI0039BEFB3E